MSKLKQNQVIAITNGKKSHAEKELTIIHRDMASKEALSGINKTYRPRDDEGDRLPDEDKIVQTTVAVSVSKVQTLMANLIDLVSTMDRGNCDAYADVIVDDIVVLENVPVTNLIYLEKKMEDIFTFVTKLPILDVAEKWAWNPNVACYSSLPKETTRTTKQLKFKILVEPTKEHPAQVEKFMIDDLAGYWTTIKMSGNIKADDKEALIVKVRKVTDAIKTAREEANSLEVSTSNDGALLMRYLFNDYLTNEN